MLTLFEDVKSTVMIRAGEHCNSEEHFLGQSGSRPLTIACTVAKFCASIDAISQIIQLILMRNPTYDSAGATHVYVISLNPASCVGQFHKL